jgi:hypothetical protein
MLCHDAECYYAEWNVLFTFMLNVIMLSFVITSVVMLSIVMLSVVILSVVAPQRRQEELFFLRQ